jgi:uncharacterized membrane protein YkvA (DUF1232 family)
MATKPPKRGKPSPDRTPLLPAKEVRAYIREKAAIMAPADVESILAREEEIRERASSETSHHPRLRRQAEMALHILGDHIAGESPQIPYFTVSLLAVALFYFLDKADAIPDWIPNIGTSDDALVVELAFEMGHAGVQRYCDFKGISAEGILPSPKPAVRERRR